MKQRITNIENEEKFGEYEYSEKDLTINEPFESYDYKKDFTSLEAWIKCREVKLFFY